MWPAQILEELQAERGRVGEVFEEVAHALQRDGSSTHELREHLLALRFALLTYTTIEDQLLPEVLRTLERWGADQMDLIGRAHVRRRGLLAQALAEMDDITTKAMQGDRLTVRGLLTRLRDSVLTALEKEDLVLRDAVARNDNSRFNGLDG